MNNRKPKPPSCLDLHNIRPFFQWTLVPVFENPHEKWAIKVSSWLHKLRRGLKQPIAYIGIAWTTALGKTSFPPLENSFSCQEQSNLQSLFFAACLSNGFCGYSYLSRRKLGCWCFCFGGRLQLLYLLVFVMIVFQNLVIGLGSSFLFAFVFFMKLNLERFSFMSIFDKVSFFFSYFSIKFPSYCQSSSQKITSKPSPLYRQKGLLISDGNPKYRSWRSQSNISSFCWKSTWRLNSILGEKDNADLAKLIWCPKAWP